MDYETPRDTRVTGDWMPEDFEGYPAKVTGTWNGFAVPLFDRETAERVVADQERIREELREDGHEADLERLEWHGDSVLVIPGEVDDSPEYLIQPRDSTGAVVGPDEGLYDLSMGWTWYEAEEDANDPARATPEQVATYRQLREDLSPGLPRGDELLCIDHEPFVRSDGTHEFRILVVSDEDEFEDSRRRVLRECGRVRIHRDGRIGTTR